MRYSLFSYCQRYIHQCVKKMSEVEVYYGLAGILLYTEIYFVNLRIPSRENTDQRKLQIWVQLTQCLEWHDFSEINCNTNMCKCFLKYSQNFRQMIHELTSLLSKINFLSVFLISCAYRNSSWKRNLSYSIFSWLGPYYFLFPFLLLVLKVTFNKTWDKQ